jgi:hypothetical protein
MSHPMDEAQRSVEELSAEEKATLEAAHKRLRAAVRNYDKFLGVELKSGLDVPAHSARAMGSAQAEIQEAEAELWQLREDLLGWHRPGWAQSAVSVSDWFSDEDSDYDDYPLPSSA